MPKPDFYWNVGLINRLLTRVDKSDVLEKIEQTVIDFFTQVMQMDSFTLRQEGIE
ncbi:MULTISPECIES: hypothetical protein [Gammaproteobacteria]|uniref:Uncharacterized protein n=2 Tax=Gammaproteobacteria TaxID=1236 RepID=F5Z5R1_ALTNA|nr:MULTISPECIES: hypothetical protein [Gammaproteobacteria]AEF05066.1 hypothetical protein ambt_17835 [Alteromonas naphthalenivorans]ETI60171.1 hypothetical protein D104_10180 [Marinomonas profundimaris]